MSEAPKTVKRVFYIARYSFRETPVGFLDIVRETEKMFFYMSPGGMTRKPEERRVSKEGNYEFMAFYASWEEARSAYIAQQSRNREAAMKNMQVATDNIAEALAWTPPSEE